MSGHWLTSIECSLSAIGGNVVAMRPSQIRAAAAETALMIPAAYGFRKAYGRLKMPVAIVAGRDDRVSEAEQSAELHRDIAHSTFRCISSNGHMLHQTATAEVMAAIDLASHKERSSQRDWNRKSPKADIGGERYLKVELHCLRARRSLGLAYQCEVCF